MPDISRILKHALAQLQQERARISHQIVALEKALGSIDGTVRRRVGAAKKAAQKTGRKRRKMSAAAKKAASQRMKKYWAERKKAKKDR